MESVILEDNPHWLNSSIYNSFEKRDVLKKTISLLTTKEIIALIGARRVGKSTIAKLLINELLKTVDAKNIFFINLEKPDFIPYKNDAAYLDKIYDEYLKLANPNKNEKIYFFIDEIQIFQNWEVFIKSKYENSNIKFIITGSNSSLLTSNYSTVLTGRVFKVLVHSFSFLEFLEFKKIAHKTTLEQVSNKIEISRAKDEYLKWGGYYSVISTEDESIKKEYLKNIAEDIILKDIVPRYKIKNSSAIHDLFFYVVSNATTSMNYSTLAKKIGIDAKMIKEYVGYFEDNFLISTISAYHNKLTKQIKSTKKVYINDNGFLNLGVNRSKNLGNILENMVFTILNQKSENITYMKDTKEIDFCVDNSDLYQVSYDIHDEKTRKRELDAFEHFNSNNTKQNTLITYDTNEENENVEIVSVEKFIFEREDEPI
ncbi:ATP-binding protein [Sulfurimonas sp. SAG-AH-194-C20]|nr:ATP-binding protein [Sulfurimonas sp. SAG-AH-194-C20]MDF1878398.1 ATP-binding protein [Sulfurimonas sp. SAG-AH-194-C20]